MEMFRTWEFRAQLITIFGVGVAEITKNMSRRNGEFSEKRDGRWIALSFLVFSYDVLVLPRELPSNKGRADGGVERLGSARLGLTSSACDSPPRVTARISAV